MEPLKKPLSFEEQIVRLREHHGLCIEDCERTKEILGRVNYYRLSAYGIGLKSETDQEKYIDGISLEHIYRLYRFDCALRALIIPVIEEIEIGLRTQIAYQLATKYGAEGYRDINNFDDTTQKDGSSNHQKTMQKLNQEIERQKNLPCVIHHNNKYGGHFPIWAAVELFSFGMLSSIFSIMKPEDKKAVAAALGVDVRYLKGWILALVEIRNICAHYGRLYNMPLKQTPRLFKEHGQYAGKKLFSRLLVMGRMLKGRSTWKTFHSSLVGLMEQYPEARLKLIDFPENWDEVLSEY